MNIGSPTRPHQLPGGNFEVKKEPRKQCSVCCALWSAAMAGAISLTFSFPFQYVLREKYWPTWRLRLDHALFVPLPIMCTAFTHQYMVSQALWSKNKHDIWTITIDTLMWNQILWLTLNGLAVAIGRNFMVKWSRTYRVNHWDYTRLRRGDEYRNVPGARGRLSTHMDCVHWYWFGLMYHAIWGLIVLQSDRVLDSTFIVMFQDFSYSEKCGPRWREWRETQLAKQENKERSQYKDGRAWENPIIPADSFKLGYSSRGDQ